MIYNKLTIIIDVIDMNSTKILEGLRIQESNLMITLMKQTVRNKIT